MPQTAKLGAEQRQRLILDHYPMVRHVAYRMVSRFPSCVEAEDLVTIGTLGLIDAVDRFEPGRSMSFGAYARIRVQGAILDELRKNDWVPRSVRDRHQRIKGAREDLRERLGRDPDERELAENLHVGVDRLRELVSRATLRVLVSMESTHGPDEDPIRETLPSEAPSPLDEATRSRLRELVRNAIDELPDRQRQIVEMYYFRELTFKDIGQVLGVTESRISQIHSATKRRLRGRLQELLRDEAA